MWSRTHLLLMMEIQTVVILVVWCRAYVNESHFQHKICQTLNRHISTLIFTYFKSMWPNRACTMPFCHAILLYIVHWTLNMYIFITQTFCQKHLSNQTKISLPKIPNLSGKLISWLYTIGALYIILCYFVYTLNRLFIVSTCCCNQSFGSFIRLVGCGKRSTQKEHVHVDSHYRTIPAIKCQFHNKENERRLKKAKIHKQAPQREIHTSAQQMIKKRSQHCMCVCTSRKTNQHKTIVNP